MSKQYYKPSIRERLCRKLLMMEPRGYLCERVLLRQMGNTQNKRVVEELALLLSDGFVIRLGTGRRGNPFRIILSETWPFNKCPLCGHVEHPDAPKFKS